MKDFKRLSQRQQNILIFIDEYVLQHGYPPTIREIGEATDIQSTSVVNYNLNKLVDDGFLERSAAKSRGLRLARPIPNGHWRITTSDDAPRVALIGQIVAGEPINVPEDYYIDDDQMIEVPYMLLGDARLDEVYALTVSGNSMVDAMIQDGDTVILRKTATANNGDMVAVWLTDRSETTLKYFYAEGERIRLQPAHPTMEPIYVDATICQVQGKVLSVMRRLR